MMMIIIITTTYFSFTLLFQTEITTILFEEINEIQCGLIYFRKLSRPPAE
jgi:hypothetical protein